MDRSEAVSLDDEASGNNDERMYHQQTNSERASTQYSVIRRFFSITTNIPVTVPSDDERDTINIELV
jgi:hypothetical protein